MTANSNLARENAVIEINSRFAGLAESDEIKSILSDDDLRHLTVEHVRPFPHNSLSLRLGEGNSDYTVMAAPDATERIKRKWIGEFFVAQGVTLHWHKLEHNS